ncbi:MAG: fasciclin domain-containing protein, partial [Pseudomonadota bacterium]
SRAGTFVTVEDAVVQTADVAATNGVVHVIDRVLMPPAPPRR